MKSYFKNMKTITKVDYATYLGVILAFLVVSVCQAQGLVSRSLGGMLVPICCYVCMSISLNLTVGILGELSLGHAGFMSVGAFPRIIAAMHSPQIACAFGSGFSASWGRGSNGSIHCAFQSALSRSAVSMRPSSLTASFPWLTQTVI